MEEIKRYTIEACRDYSDCWLDVSEAIEQDYLTEELYCKDADVQGLEKQISDHKAVVEKMQNKIDELEIENKSLECCCNCKWYAVGPFGGYCDREDKALCSKWNPSEPSAVNLWAAKGINRC